MQKKVKDKAYKQMLWISMISMTMMFAGLTSAFVVSENREDWVNLELPQAFFISTILIVLSSITLFIAKTALKKGKDSQTTVFLLITLVLGIGFIFYQFKGFGQLIDAGLYFTGAQSNISSSFLYVITLAHMVHIAAGIIVLIWVTIKHLNHKYSANDMLGFELASIFWHFVDVLWIYLFLFFYFLG